MCEPSLDDWGNGGGTSVVLFVSARDSGTLRVDGAASVDPWFPSFIICKAKKMETVVIILLCYPRRFKNKKNIEKINKKLSFEIAMHNRIQSMNDQYKDSSSQWVSIFQGLFLRYKRF